MSIVAHQFNILSEQLRKGIGGLNEGKKQASRQALEMEQLKYGIEKDKRVQKRADAADTRAQEMHDAKLPGAELQQVQDMQNMQKVKQQMNQPASVDNIVGMLELGSLSPEDQQSIITEGAANHGYLIEDGKLYNTGQDGAASVPVNMHQLQNSPGFIVQALSKDLLPAKKKMIAQYEAAEEASQERGDAFIEGVENEEQMAQVEQKVEALRGYVKEYESNPIKMEEIKYDKMAQALAQVTDDQALRKFEILLSDQHSKIADMKAAKAAKTAKSEKRDSVFYQDDITGKITEEKVARNGLTDQMRNAGWKYNKPAKQDPKYVDPSNKKTVDKELDRLNKLATAYRTGGGLEGIDKMAYSSEELRALSDDPGAVAVREQLDERILRMEEIKKLPPTVDVDLGNGRTETLKIDLDTIAGIMRETGRTYDEVLDAMKEELDSKTRWDR